MKSCLCIKHTHSPVLEPSNHLWPLQSVHFSGIQSHAAFICANQNLVFPPAGFYLIPRVMYCLHRKTYFPGAASGATSTCGSIGFKHLFYNMWIHRSLTLKTCREIHMFPFPWCSVTVSDQHLSQVQVWTLTTFLLCEHKCILGNIKEPPTQLMTFDPLYFYNQPPLLVMISNACTPPHPSVYIHT